MLQKKLGQRIADLRKARQLTQAGLAKKIGCSEDFISLVSEIPNLQITKRQNQEWRNIFMWDMLLEW